MSKLIYSVREVFDKDPQKGCLGLNGADRYYIAPYQRGYKWQSADDWDSPAQVNTLLRDVYDAWIKDSQREYYLQFITVKKRIEQGRTNSLEVIDGQQRLTTLSIILSVLKLRGALDKEQYSHLKKSTIDYACSSDSLDCLNNFFGSDNMPDSEKRKKDQTIHFLCEAKEKVENLLGLDDKFGDRLPEFVDYLLERVKIIVNVVQEGLSSETVFGNLNGRKVVLTDMELIKGLILCRAARADGGIAYRQVLERRAMMGRTWDEIERWLSDGNRSMYFFGEKASALYDFLLLVIYRKDMGQEKRLTDCYDARFESWTSGSKRYRLFNWYYKKVKVSRDAVALFHEIEDVFWALRDIYDDVGRYNTCGFILFKKVGTDRITLLNRILGFGPSWKKKAFPLVWERFSQRTEKMNSSIEFIKSYRGGYSDRPDQLRLDLMLINCFQLDDKGMFIANGKRCFPFYDVQSGKDATKSLEHVQPQHPTNTDNVWRTIRDGSAMIKLLTMSTAKKLADKQYEPFNKELVSLLEEMKDRTGLVDTVVKFERGEIAVPKERERDAVPPEDFQSMVEFYGHIMQAYNQPFEKFSLAVLEPEIFGDYKTTCKDSIGNIVLVTGALNSALSNRNFAEKRRLMRDKLNRGENVPPHTFNVFSKFSGKGTCLDCWFIGDVVDNAKVVLEELFKLRKALAEYGKVGL